MVSFNEPWGFVKNSRDEKGLLESWRQGLDFLGWATRFKFFRKHVMTFPGIAALLIPSPDSHTGMGFLIKEADAQVTKRETELSQGLYPEQPDFMQQ